MTQSITTTFKRLHCTIIAIAFLMLACPLQTTFAQPTDATALAQLEDQKLLNGLRDRRLFDLADDYCQNLLDSSDLPPQRRATLVVHQLKTITAKAVSSSSNRRNEVWQQVDVIAKKFLSSFRGSRALLVRAQQALATTAQARLIRQEIDARLAQPDARSTAISLLRSAQDELDDTIRSIDKAIPRSKTNQTPTDLSTPQLLALKANLQFQFAICNLERSQLYPADDQADRKDALNQALEQIANANRTTEKGKTLWWEVKIASIKCLRLLGRYKEANTTLQALPTKLLPTGLKPQLRIEHLQVALASQDHRQVGALVAQVLEKTQRPPSEDIGLVQATAWLARTTPPSQSVDWKRMADSLVKSIKSSHGRYWGRRAELLLVESIQENAATNPDSILVSPDADLLILSQAAQTALQEERFKDAANDFAKAILLAKQQSNLASVLQLSIQQGQVFEKLGQPADAADAMIDAANIKPNLANAAAAHLRGCWNLSQTITGPDSKQQAQRFQKRLEQHIETWPATQTAESALLWLGEQHHQSQKYRTAFDTFLRVPTSSKRFPQAATQAAASATGLLLKLEQTNQPLNIMTERLLGQLRDLATQAPSLKPTTELLAADIDIRFRSRLPSQSTLNEILKDQPTIDSRSSEHLADLRLAIQTISNIKDSAAFTQQLTQTKGKPQVQQRLHGYLNAMRTREDSSNSNRTLAAANLQVAQQAINDAQQSNPNDLATAWKLRMVQLHQSMNQHEPAIELLTGLIKAHPRKADLQIQLAHAMTAAYGKSAPEKPINQWRRLASRLRPESENWFLAKYNVAELLLRSGKRSDALKLLKYIKANPPGWDNSQLKPDFDSLLQKLN